MKRRAAVCLLAAPALAAGLGGCAGVGARRVVIGEAELQSRLAAQFPRRERVLEVIDVTVSQPQVRLRAGQQRIATEVAFDAVERLSGRPFRGSLALDHGLRLDLSDGTLRLADVRVERMALESGGNALSGTARRIGGLVAERLLDGVVVWRASAAQLERARAAGLAAATVQVTERGIELQLDRGS